MAKPLKDFALDQEAIQAEERREHQRANRLQKEVSELRKMLRLREEISSAAIKTPRWVLPKRTDRGDNKDPVTVCLTVADLHLDEVVDPYQVDGMNAYNAEIAEFRLQELARRTIMLCRDYVAGVDIEGIVLFWVGDNISGNIHQELLETNERTVMESIVYWVPQLAAFVDAMAEEFGKVYCVGVCGNHDRGSMKPRSKNRMQDSFDWIIYHWLSDKFKDDERVTWRVPESMDARVQVGNTRYLLTHGDQFRGGSGISGMLSPLMIGLNRKTRRELAAGHPFDWMVFGHFHQYWQGKGMIASGALVGYNEYNFSQNHEFEPPSQALWINSARGITVSMPVYPSNPKKEGWE